MGIGKRKMDLRQNPIEEFVTWIAPAWTDVSRHSLPSDFKNKKLPGPFGRDEASAKVASSRAFTRLKLPTNSLSTTSASSKCQSIPTCAAGGGCLLIGCWMLDVGCSMFSVRCSVFDVQCSVFSVQCSVFSVQCSTFRHRRPKIPFAFTRFFDILLGPSGSAGKETASNFCARVGAGGQKNIENNPVFRGML
jgi:hypothetical protein